MSKSDDLKKALANDPSVQTFVEMEETNIEPINELSERHKTVAYLAALGMSQKHICENLGYTQSWMSTVMGSQRMRDEINRVRKELFSSEPEKMLKRSAGKAVEVIHDVLHN